MNAPALLALLVLTQAQTPRPVESSADTLELTPSTRASKLIGHATLTQGALTLRADEIDYAPDEGRAVASGNVLFADGLLGGTALHIELDLGQNTGRFEGATLWQKGQATPAQIAAARTSEQMRLVGKNELTLRADVVQKLAHGAFEAYGLYLTPCDCSGPGFLTEPPSWSVRAKAALVKPGESARLTWATLYIKDVPALPLPVILLPLSNRQTGFLLPKPNYTGRNGFQLEQPFFWAINKSWDATLTPGYFFGEDHSTNTTWPVPPSIDSTFGTFGKLTPGQDLTPLLPHTYTVNNANDPGANYGMEGPRIDTELRYTPSLDTHGRLTFALVDDLKPVNDSPHRGLRGEMSFTHVQNLGEGFSDRVDAAGVSDQDYFRDVTADLFSAQASYLRSDARVDHKTDNTEGYVTASYYQALNGTPPQPYSLQPFFGPNNVNQDTFQRLPAFAFAVEEQGLGPLRLLGQVDGARYAPLAARTLQLCPPIGANPATGAPTYDPLCAQDSGLVNARSVENRIGVQPELRLPLKLGRFAELTPYVIGRADAWHVESSSDEDRARAFGVFGATLESELSRTFAGSGNVRWRNVIAPSVEVRGTPGSIGKGPDVPDDEIDAPFGSAYGVGPIPTQIGPAPNAFPAGGASASNVPAVLQGIAMVRTRFDRREGQTFTEPIRADIGQGYDLERGVPGDSFADLAVQFGPVNASGTFRYSISERRVAGLGAHAVWTTSAGSTLSLGYVRLRSFLTDPMRAGLFDLVGPPGPVEPNGLFTDRLDIAGHWRASTALSLDLGLTYLPNAYALDAFSSSSGNTNATPVWQRLAAYSAGVNYGSPCDCWSLRLGVLIQPSVFPGQPFKPTSFFFVLDAHRLGGSVTP